MSNVLSVLHKSLIVKQLERQANVKVNTSNNPVVMVNMVTFGLDLNQTQAKDSNSSMLSLVVLFQENTLSQQLMV